MLIGEIPKSDKIIISFEIHDRPFEFTTDLLEEKAADPHAAFAAPIVIQGNDLHIDSRCRNLCVKFPNARSGRVHLWENVRVQYTDRPTPRYIIMSPDDSKQYNRRGAIRVSINTRSKCSISNIEGVHPCTIQDVSISGVGINIDISIAERHLTSREVVTKFYDEITEQTFQIRGRCVHTTRLFKDIYRCGCEIIEVQPSINEYINLKQMHRLVQTTNRAEA